MGRFWMSIVAASFGLLALIALATHIVFFFKRPNERRPFALAVFFLLPHLLLCAVLIGTSAVLGSHGILSQLVELKLDFLGRLLFYVSVVWFPTILVFSLMPVDGGAFKDCASDTNGGGLLRRFTTGLASGYKQVSGSNR